MVSCLTRHFVLALEFSRGSSFKDVGSDGDAWIQIAQDVSSKVLPIGSSLTTWGCSAVPKWVRKGQLSTTSLLQQGQ